MQRRLRPRELETSPTTADRPPPTLTSRATDPDLIDEISRFLSEYPAASAADTRTDRQPTKVVLALSGSAHDQELVDGLLATTGLLRMSGLLDAEVEVEVLHIREYDASRGLRFFLRTTAEVDELTGHAVERMRSHGIRASSVVREATRPEVARAIVVEAAKARASLLVVGRYRRGILDAVITRNVVRPVLRSSPCGVLVLPVGRRPTGATVGTSAPTSR